MASKNIALRIFACIAAGTAVVGGGSGIIINSYYKTDATEEHPLVDKYLAEKMPITEFLENQKINYPWVQRGEFKLVTKAKDINSEEYVVSDNLVTFDKKQKSFTFESVCNGEMTLISDFDSTILYTVKFSTKFKSSDVEGY